MKNLKALQLFFEQTQTAVRMCDVDDCYENTREGKIYCSNHIEKQPYIQELMKRIQDRTQEDELVRQEGSTAVNLEGITSKEIRLQLQYSGTRTEERLTRELQVDKTIVHNYAIRLQTEGVIRFGRTNRNNLTIVLVGFDPSKAINDDDEDDDED